MVATTSLHSKKVTVWCALLQRDIIGPFYFEENEKTTTINSKRYIAVLELFWQELQTQYPELHKRMWFQQDGAPVHTANASLDWLKVQFKKRVVSRKTTIGWPPDSPDLSPPDFFLWGYLKEKIYKNKPQTLEQLKNNIEQEIRAISKMF